MVQSKSITICLDGQAQSRHGAVQLRFAQGFGYLRCLGVVHIVVHRRLFESSSTVSSTSQRTGKLFLAPDREAAQAIESTPVVGQAPIGIGQAVTIANQLFPDGVITVVFLPVGDNGVFKVLKHKGNKIMFSSRQQTIVIDAYSGRLLYQTDQSKRTSGDIFNEWQLALHCGEAFGVTGQIIVLITGLAPLVLYVTGIIRWLQKRRVRKFKNM